MCFDAFLFNFSGKMFLFRFMEYFKEAKDYGLRCVCWCNAVELWLSIIILDQRKQITIMKAFERIFENSFCWNIILPFILGQWMSRFTLKWKKKYSWMYCIIYYSFSYIFYMYLENVLQQSYRERKLCIYPITYFRNGTRFQLNW